MVQKNHHYMFLFSLVGNTSEIHFGGTADVRCHLIIRTKTRWSWFIIKKLFYENGGCWNDRISCYGRESGS